MAETCVHTAEVNGSFVAHRNFDPTYTTTLRNAFARDMRKRFDELIRAIRLAIVERDVFGLQRPTVFQVVAPRPNAFNFPTNPAKIAAFMQWLQEQIDKGILQVTEMPQLGMGIEGAWTNKYIEDSYKRGVIRARIEMQKADMDVPPIEATGGIGVSMSTPVHLDRVGIAYIRSYAGLKGITTAMDTQISRVLAQGLADGDGPRLIARKLVSTIDGENIGKLGITDSVGRFIPAKRRAEMLARTEVIRAHHFATIQEYRNWAVEGVIVKAEFMTAQDNRVCPRCEALHGQVFTLDQIQNMIPQHPGCRCVALPFKQQWVTRKTRIREQVRIGGQ